MFDINTIPILDSLDGSELIVVYINGEPSAIEAYKILNIPVQTVTPIVAGLNATAASDSEIDVVFTSSGDDFIVEKSQNEYEWNTFDINTLLSYADTGLQESTEYFYRVKARKAGQRDSDWAYISATTLAAP